MNKVTNYQNISAGQDCTQIFREAYENRYTWDNKSFSGYKGDLLLNLNNKSFEGSFILGSDLKSQIYGIDNDQVVKLVSSQLWEVSIHRVRRSFNEVHGKNTFLAGDINEDGIEILVGGKNNGDKYRIKDNIITMVYRHIHGTLICINTKSTIETGLGYLSNAYTSQYLDPITTIPSCVKNNFQDTFKPLFPDGPWVLTERVITKEAQENEDKETKRFVFLNIRQL